MDKLIRDGKVAVIYSPGFGAGWSTWGAREHRATLAMDKVLAECVESQDWDGARTRLETLNIDTYDGGLEDCLIEWVPVGTVFFIKEYDGAESVVYEDEDFLVA